MYMIVDIESPVIVLARHPEVRSTLTNYSSRWIVMHDGFKRSGLLRLARAPLLRIHHLCKSLLPLCPSPTSSLLGLDTLKG